MSIIAITQNKVAGLGPRWAPFPGFSILFDNPGNSMERTGNLRKVSCSATTGGPLELYRRLEVSLAELGRERLLQTFLFCPLNPSSYHVTVWDGVNAGNIASLRPGIRPDWKTFLQDLPDSLAAPPESIAVVSESDLMRGSLGAIGLCFDTLEVWRNQALVARLRPSADSNQSFPELCQARARLCDEASRALGVSPSQIYSPHVTLGYFANQEGGRRANAQVEAWTDMFRTHLAAAEVAYPSMALYGFTDMLCFFKLERPRQALQADSQ